MKSRIQGLDAIRLLAASAVLFVHLDKPPLFVGMDVSSKLSKTISNAYNNSSIAGACAVMIFFVISGFCIHYPYRHFIKPNWFEFFGLRYIRIGLPMIAIIIISNIVKAEGMESVLWSLYCELIYYTIYPLLLRIANSIGWRNLTILSFIPAYVVIATLGRSDFGGIYTFGIGFAWLVALPCWLLGCHLASDFEKAVIKFPGRSIWLWRIAIIMIAFAISTSHYLFNIHYYWTLDLYGILVYFWLKREIVYFQEKKPLEWLEKGGKWSYSIYLCHIPAAKLFQILNLPNLGYLSNWLLLMFFVFVFSYVFYRVIEAPSHTFAKLVKQRVGGLQIWLQQRLV